MSRAEVAQSMRTGVFGEFLVLGSQYSDEAGQRNWYIALLAKPNPVARTHHEIAGELPDGLTADERDAVAQAIRM